jgi:hypothetical protein
MAFPLMLIPMMVSTAVNAGRAIHAAGQNKNLKQDYLKAEGAVNPMDPMQMSFLNRQRAMEQRFRAGTDPSSAWAMQNVNQQDAQRQSNLLGAGGPGAVGNILRSGQIAGQGAAQVGGQAAAMGNQLVGMQMGMTNLIANRIYDRQREVRNQALARWQQNRQDVQNAISGLTATLPDMASQTNWVPNQGGQGGSNAATQKANAPMNPMNLVGNSLKPPTQPYAPMVPNSPSQPSAPMYGPQAPQAPQWWVGGGQPSWYTP